MKINIVIPTILMGGGLRVIFQYANNWVEKGHDVLAYVPMIYEEVDRKIKIRTSIANTFLRGTEVTWYECNFPIKKAVLISDMWIRDADIVIAIAPSSVRAVSRLSDRKGKKVSFIQGHELNEKKSNLEDIDRTYKYDINMVTITNFMKNYIKKVSGRDAEVIYNGIPEAEYIQKEKVIHEPRCIIMLANFGHYKGGYSGLDILKKISKKYNVRCVLYGVSYDEKIPEEFEFYQQPSREKLMQLYDEADICLFPSVEEGWGLIVTEAMAHKCAIVGNNTGCLREFGVHRKNALISDTLDYSKLQMYIEELIKDDNLLRELQENGWNTAQLLRNEKSFVKFEKFLLDLL